MLVLFVTKKLKDFDDIHCDVCDTSSQLLAGATTIYDSMRSRVYGSKAGSRIIEDASTIETS